MRILVSSASGSNGNGFGRVIEFDEHGRVLGWFGRDARIHDPRGLYFDAERQCVFVNSGSDRVLALDLHGEVVADSGHVPGLNPGGGTVDPRGGYLVGSRGRRTVVRFPMDLVGGPEPIVPLGVVPFPRGFAVDGDGTLFLASGTGPDGRGDDEVIAFGPSGEQLWATRDEGVSPLDLTMSPRGNPMVSSERPFGAEDAEVTVREYDRTDGRLIRVLRPTGAARMSAPRGLRFRPDGRLLVVARDDVVEFDYDSGMCRGAVVTLPGLHGQAIVVVPSEWRSAGLNGGG